MIWRGLCTTTIYTATFFMAANAAMAQTPTAFSCTGVLPAWDLELDENRGVLSTYKPIEMQVMDTTTTQGRDWPLAITLVGEEDTAIIILTPRACTSNAWAGHYEALVLTQQDNTPVMLLGCCQANAQ